VTLNVKAEGYSMDCTLLCEDSTGNRVELTSDGLNQINFGEVGQAYGILKYKLANIANVIIIIFI